MNLTTVESFFSAAYLEDYLDCVENLPDDLQRNISYMRELDVTYQDILHDLELHQSNLSRDTDGAGRKKTLIHIQRGLIRSQEIGDEKLQVIQQILDLVENKSRQLDVDYRNISLRSTFGKDQENSEPFSRGGIIGGLGGGGGEIQPERSSKRARRQRNDCGLGSIRDEQLLLSSGIGQHHLSQYSQQVHHQPQQNQQQPQQHLQQQQQQQQHHNQQRDTKEQNQKEQHREHSERQTAATDESKTHHHITSSGGGGGGTGGGWASSSSNTAAASKKTKKKKRKSKTTDKDHHQGGQNHGQQQHSTSRGGDSPIDLQPIDPDEPTYCLCQQISYGEMIGCDNDRCPIEWFHFSCVALTTKPKGKWYCPRCRGDRPNIMKPSSRN